MEFSNVLILPWMKLSKFALALREVEECSPKEY